MDDIHNALTSLFINYSINLFNTLKFCPFCKILYKPLVQCSTFVIRDGLQDMDLDVGRWLRKWAPGLKTIVVINKAEKLDAFSGSLAASIGEAYSLGFGDPVALSAETGFGMSELHEALKPLLEDYVLQVLPGKNLTFNS